MDTTHAIEIQGISKIFGEADAAFRALDAVSLKIRENEFFTLLGPSGSGKSTLLRLIAGFEHPNSGSIHLYDEDLTGLAPFRRPINTVFQNYALFPHMTVAENIGFGLQMQGKADIDKQVAEMLRLVRMEDFAERRVQQISGGQQQRVALARALAPHPKVLLLDEPLSALDLKLRKEMQLELKNLQHRTGITFVFVTHDQEEALTMSDRVAVMNEGRILQVGTPREIYTKPRSRFVAHFIGEMNMLEATVEKANDGSTLLQIGDLQIAIPNGNELTAGTQVTAALRPEHAELVTASEDSHLTGELSNIVYFGSDTHYHLRLPGGSDFVVRAPNLPSTTRSRTTGRRYGIRLNTDAIRLLED